MSLRARKIRVFIVDDSVIACRILSETLSQDPGIEVAGTALSGPIALSRLNAVDPDLVMVDLDMPVMDGLQTLLEIKKIKPKLPVIMCSPLFAPGNRHAMQALLGGAADWVAKPSAHMNGGAGLDAFAGELSGKIKSIFGSKTIPAMVSASVSASASAPAQAAAFPIRDFGVKPRGVPEILAIGVSTGGPQALMELLPRLPADFPVPIVIVQHMPPLFTKSLAASIGGKSRIKVEEGFEGRRLEAGQAWLAPGGFHMQVVKRKGGYELAINSDEPVNSCRPAVDVLFKSVVDAFGSKVLAVVLTGMGQDGLVGAEAVRRAGGTVLVQDQATSVVWGMPGAIAKAGLADRIVPLSDMPLEIQAVFSKKPAAAMPQNSQQPRQET
jgi:two-component system, chemotaxis family, protein-glutamate methylesterase/glutaminase